MKQSELKKNTKLTTLQPTDALMFDSEACNVHID